MKEIKQRFTPFTAIVIMLTIITVAISIQSLFIYLSMSNDNNILNELNRTTTSTNYISEKNNQLINDTRFISETNNELISSNNAILEQTNRTATAIIELRQLQESLGNVPVENQAILENITESIESILERLS